MYPVRKQFITQYKNTSDKPQKYIHKLKPTYYNRNYKQNFITHKKKVNNELAPCFCGNEKMLLLNWWPLFSFLNLSYKYQLTNIVKLNSSNKFNEKLQLNGNANNKLLTYNFLT